MGAGTGGKNKDEGKVIILLPQCFLGLIIKVRIILHPALTINMVSRLNRQRLLPPKKYSPFYFYNACIFLKTEFKSLKISITGPFTR